MTFFKTATTIRKMHCTYVHYNNTKRVTLRTNINSSRLFKLVPHFDLFSKNAVSKRSSAYTSLMAKASLTLEAAISIPLFFFGLLSLICITNIIYIQLSLQIALEETIRDISRESYISTEFYSLSSDEQNDAIDKNASITENIGATLISVSYIKKQFFTDDIINLIDNSYIKEGYNGVSFALSSVDLNTNTLDIVINYKYSIPFIPSNLLTFNLSNHCYTKIYMGQDMDKKQKETYYYVYFATTSKVFHTNKYCQYLLNYSKAIRYREANNYLAFSCCAFCARQENIINIYETNPVIYLTSQEITYHLSLDCQTYTKDIFRNKVSNLDDIDICEKCLEGK